jgi:hypothetical protein
MNPALKKNEKYRKKYMRSHKMLTLLLDKEVDADIIKWLETRKAGERSAAVRTAIRKEIKNV